MRRPRMSPFWQMRGSQRYDAWFPYRSFAFPYPYVGEMRTMTPFFTCALSRQLCVSFGAHVKTNVPSSANWSR